jgi:hypothetical protein
LESKGAAAVDAVASQLGESLERVLKRIKKRGA